MPEKVIVESELSTDELNEKANSISGVTPEDFDRLVEEARLVVHLGEKNIWAKADIAAEAAQKYGKLRELTDRLNVSYGYWRILSSVAQAYSEEERDRFLDLTFAHYQAVAGRHNKMELLQRAHDENLTVFELQRLAAQDRDPTGIVKAIESKPMSNVEAARLARGRDIKPLVGRTLKEASELLNYIASLDPDVALGIGAGARECRADLQSWLEEALGKPANSGVSVLDLFNLMFLDQGYIRFTSMAEPEPFMPVERIKVNENPEPETGI